MHKKPVSSAVTLRWSREWYKSASAEELLLALHEADVRSHAGTPMEQLVDQLVWEVRFQVLEDELRRRMTDSRSA